MVKGSRVAFNAEGLRWQMAPYGTLRRHKIDWSAACGVIKNITRDKKSARVVWDGNRHKSDAIPLKFLRLVK